MNTIKDKEAKAAIIAGAKNEHDRDSLAEVKRKESNQLILDGFGKAIGKYSLGYDSAKHEIVALQKLIKDSKPTNQGDNPNINFTPDKGISVDSFTNNFIGVRVNITSNSAPSILKEATLYCLYSDNQKENVFKDLKYDTKVPFLSKNLGFIKDGFWEGGIDMPGYNVKQIKTIIILIKGSYTDSYGKNPQTLDKVGSFDLVLKKFTLVVRPYDDIIRTFLIKKGIIK